MKKSYFKLSFVIVSALAITQYSCTSESDSNTDKKSTPESKLDLSLYPVEEKALNYVDSISLTDTVSLIDNDKKDVKNHLTFLSNQKKFWWKKLE